MIRLIKGFFATVIICGAVQAYAADMAYVADSLSRMLYPLDVTTNTIGTGIAIGAGPEMVLISPDTTKVFVTNQNQYTVSVIDTLTNKVIKSIPVGTAPKGIAITSDGTKAYVVSQSSHDMHIIDISTLAVVGKPVDLGEKTLPRFIAITPNGKTAYVTQHENDVIRKIDLQTLAMSNISVPQGSGPEGIVIDSTGSFAVVVYQYSGKLAKLDLATDSLVAELNFGSNMESPTKVILSPDNKIAYVAKMGNIAPIAMSTFTALPEISTGQDSPFYIALTSDGSKGFATVPLAEKIVPFTPHDSKTQEPIRNLKLPGGIDIKARR